MRLLGKPQNRNAWDIQPMTELRNALKVDSLIKEGIPEPKEMAEQTSKTDRRKGKAHRYPTTAGQLQVGTYTSNNN